MLGKAKKKRCFYLKKLRFLGDAYIVLLNSVNNQEVNIPIAYSTINNVSLVEMKELVVPAIRKLNHEISEGNYEFKILCNKEEWIESTGAYAEHIIPFTSQEIGNLYEALR